MFRYPLGEPPGDTPYKFSEIDWESGSKYLEITVDGVTLMPRMEMLSEAYAINADKLDGRDYDAFVSTRSENQDIGGVKTFKGETIFESKVGIGTTSPGAKLEVSAKDTDSYSLRVGTGNTYHLVVSTSGKIEANLINSNYEIRSTYNNILSIFSLDNRASLQISDDDTNTWLGSENGKSFISNTGSDLGSGQLVIDNNGNVGIGITNPGAKLDVQGEIKSLVNGTTFYMVPRGAIIMWAGSIGDIPSGWALCDGTNGTPDLRGRFIVGYDSGDTDYDVIGSTGGEKRHTLTIDEMPRHRHSLQFQAGDTEVNYYIRRSGEGSFVSNTPAPMSYTGGDQPHENRPPYYVLAYIMKL